MKRVKFDSVEIKCKKCGTGDTDTWWYLFPKAMNEVGYLCPPCYRKVYKLWKKEQQCLGKSTSNVIIDQQQIEKKMVI